MLDILESLNKVEKKAKESLRFNCVAFTQSEQCRLLIEEAFRFDGLVPPTSLPNTDADIQAHVRQSEIEIVLVELNDSPNVTEDMQRISHLLPNHASVIVIGQEDAISTIRNLKAMGFYYLFWPVTKAELLDFVKNVFDNRVRASGLGKKRYAKNIAVWGCAGGAGTSLLCCEIGHGLAKQYHAKCLIVDHDYYAGNIDILLKLEGFEKKPATIASVDHDLDGIYASSLTRKVNDMLSVLSLTSETHDAHELKEYIRTLEALLYEHNNFVISDLSKGGQTNADYQYLTDKVDTAVLVVNPTVSGVRQLKKILQHLTTHSPSSRQILVLNHVRPAKAAILSRVEVEKFLGRPIDIEIPYEQDLLKHILDGGYLHQSKLSVAASIQELIGMIMGETAVPKKKTFTQWLLRK